jgi:replicative DNA helicase
LNTSNTTKRSKKKRARTQFTAVTTDRPCPVCNGDHKCSVGADGLILCGRSNDKVDGFAHLGQAKNDPQFGQYRRLGDEATDPSSRGEFADRRLPTKDWTQETARFQQNLTPELGRELAGLLLVPLDSLLRLGLGWDPQGYWTVTERDAEGAVVGINCRDRAGHKRMVPGSTRGLYYVADWDVAGGAILCPEGLSDTAALVTMGLVAVGRPSNTGGVQHLAKLFAGINVNINIIIIGDNDPKLDGSCPGLDGARTTAEQLARALGRPIYHAPTPDGRKDSREWLRHQNVDLDDDDELEDVGQKFLKTIKETMIEALVWDPFLDLDDPDLPPFPISVFAPWLRQFVESLAVATQTPVDLAAMLTLSVIAVACARKLVVRVRPGYSEPVNVYTLVTQPPASRKSSVFREVEDPLEEFEREKVNEARPIIAAALSELRIREKRLEELQKKAAKLPGAEGEECRQQAETLAQQIAETKIPASPRLITDDATPEKAASLMATNGGRIAILSPEGGIVSHLAGQYRSAKTNHNIDIYLKGHAGDTLRVDRVGRASEYVDRPALTIGLAVQPDVIQCLSAVPTLRGRGFLARILFAIPKSLVGRRIADPPPVPDTVRGEYHQRMRRLLEMPAGTTDDGEPAENVVNLSPEAYSRWLAFSNLLEPMLAGSGELASLDDWGGKLAGAVVRIAGLLHASDLAGEQAPWEVPIPAATMDRAITVGRYLIPHARAAFAAMGADPGVAAAKHVLDWVRRNRADNFTRRECFEATKSRFRKVEALEAPLRILEQHGYIRERTPVVPRDRGRPASPVYHVNPSLRATNPGPSLPSINANPATGGISVGTTGKTGAVESTDEFDQGGEVEYEEETL